MIIPKYLPKLSAHTLIVCEAKTSNANRQWDHKFANKISIDSLSRSQSFACRSAPSRQPSAVLSGVWCVRAPNGEKIKRGVKNFSIQCCNLLRPPQDESWVSVSPLLWKALARDETRRRAKRLEIDTCQNIECKACWISIHRIRRRRFSSSSLWIFLAFICTHSSSLAATISGFWDAILVNINCALKME